MLGPELDVPVNVCLAKTLCHCVGGLRVLVAGYGEFSTEGCIPDNVNGAKFVRDLYEKVDDNAGESEAPCATCRLNCCEAVAASKDDCLHVPLHQADVWYPSRHTQLWVSLPTLRFDHKHAQGFEWLN